tara:strand:- start:4892 stop:5461 length:570 start_codon:yes stop_codon:yes gene_type:complete
MSYFDFLIVVATCSLLLFVSHCAESEERKHLYVIGDSLSSPTGCEWPRELDDQYAIHNLAQAGLTMEAFDMPHHQSFRDDSTVVIMMGSNDAGSGVSVLRYKMRLRETIRAAKTRGADRVLVGGPPEIESLLPAVTKYRKAAKRVAKNERVAYFTVKWDADQTIDGLHPTCNFNRLIADQVRNEIERAL